MVKGRMTDIKPSGTTFLVSFYNGLVCSFCLLLPPRKCLGQFILLLLPPPQLSQTQAFPILASPFSCVIHDTLIYSIYNPFHCEMLVICFPLASGSKEILLPLSWALRKASSPWNLHLQGIQDVSMHHFPDMTTAGLRQKYVLHHMLYSNATSYFITWYAIVVHWNFSHCRTIALFMHLVLKQVPLFGEVVSDTNQDEQSSKFRFWILYPTYSFSY